MSILKLETGNDGRTYDAFLADKVIRRHHAAA